MKSARTFATSRGKGVINAPIDAVPFDRRRAGQRVVVRLREGVGRRRVGLRPGPRQRSPDRTDTVGGDAVAGEGLADELTRIARVGSRGRRIVNDNRLAVRISEVRKIADAPFRQRHREGVHRSTLLPQPFVVHEKEGAVSSLIAGERDRAADVTADLAPAEVSLFLSRTVGEEVGGVQRAVAPEPEERPMKCIGSALSHQIDDAAADGPNSALTALVCTLNSWTASTDGV